MQRWSFRIKYDCAVITNCGEFGGEDVSVPNGNCGVENNKIVCYQCLGDYYPSKDGRTCVHDPDEPEEFICSEHITGCLECNKDYECIKCDTNNHWKLDENEHECVCDG